MKCLVWNFVLSLVGASFAYGSEESENGDRAVESRQFDFWLGEWSVNNRALKNDGSWFDSGKAKARITPLFDRRLVIEQWDGVNHGAEVIGFSARAYDPQLGKWILLLNWPGGGNPGFGTLEGSFRHGRGEFFAKGGTQITRYSFSDGLPNTTRWDASYSNDGGQTWRTDWIMEFTRTGAASSQTEDRLFTDIDPKNVCPHQEATQFDFLAGEWEVLSETLKDGDIIAEQSMSLRVAKILSGCAVIELYKAEDADEQLFRVSSFIPAIKYWESWSIDNRHSRFSRRHGKFEEADTDVVFGGTDEGGNEIERVIWLERSSESFEWEQQAQNEDGEWQTVRRFLGARGKP